MKRISFDYYNSKVKRINLPIPSFEYVHKSWFSKRLGSATPGFMIGRDRIIEKLKTWLTKEKTDGGSYLITGYRGMGKTCFVDRVLYELVGDTNLLIDSFGYILLAGLAYCIIQIFNGSGSSWLWSGIVIALFLLWIICKYFFLKEKCKKYGFRIKTAWIYIKRDKRVNDLWPLLRTIHHAWTKLTPKEWDRINGLIYGSNVKNKRYSHICVNINLGQEILDERSILCVLTTELYNKFKLYVFSPIANIEFWLIYSVLASTVWITVTSIPQNSQICDWLRNIVEFNCNVIAVISIIVLWFIVFSHHLRTLYDLKKLSRRIDAAYSFEIASGIGYKGISANGKETYNYPIANTRNIESQLIAILDRIERFPIHPKFYFVFDELDKIETALKVSEMMPEFTNERYHPSGGTSRKRQTMVLHLLANMKFFTTTAKAKFIFIAGREMYDGYLADMTDRESAISSLFNGVIYVESFCKNEKSEKDVMYNAETFIARQLIPRYFIEEKIINQYIQCKLADTIYQNIDIDLKMYYEYLTLIYTDSYLKFDDEHSDERRKAFDEARVRIDKVIGLLYHFTVYLYHVSNGSPKKMRLSFENMVRPLRNRREFLLGDGDWKNNYDGTDLDIHISSKCKYLLSFGEKEQKVIGFIHYITFPVNQIMTDANQFGDKLLVSASFLINHIYKYHSGGFSWRNIEQTPELLEVYKIPEFRSFIRSILTYLLQTHIIQIPFGLFQFKFRKQISEEISLASKMSEEVSTLFNFTREESQAVKEHYRRTQLAHNKVLAAERLVSQHSVAGLHHIMGDLYMADEDYNNAIIAYQTALSEIDKSKNIAKGKLVASYYLPYTRNMLKLGLAYEKRRTMAAAYSVYGTLVGKLIEFLVNDSKTNSEEKNSTTGSKKNKKYTSEEYRQIEKNSLIENTKLIYQASLAKLFVNEKMETGGITRVNVDMVIDEFNTLNEYIHNDEKFMLSSDFHKKLGDIMFYKNGMVGFDFGNSNVDVPYTDCCSFSKDKRNAMWRRNRTLPCYACCYYKQSMEVLLKKLFNEVETEKKEKVFVVRPSKIKVNPIEILQLIVVGGSAKTMRQNHMLQMGEVLDCLGNTMLACEELKGTATDKISVDFLCKFLHDVSVMNEQIDKDKKLDSFKLLDGNLNEISNLELAIIYFWEASVTFRYGREQKKASGSLKKILRLIQNYLRISETKLKWCTNTDEKEGDTVEGLIKRKVIIGEFLNEIKNRIVKQCLINLYAHYNFINLVEIQRLKWIFYTQMYENISLNRLSLFPDVEEIMLIYYEMIRLCVISKEHILCADGLFNEIRDSIKENRNANDDIFSWAPKAQARNHDFNRRLTGIYNNVSLSPVRHDNTSYERILSLRFKAEMNRYILGMAFPEIEKVNGNITKRSAYYINIFIEKLNINDEEIKEAFSWKLFFPHVYGNDNLYTVTLQDRLMLLEFLIKDSIYCLTYILESITPYTSTTLFTHSFIGSIYRDVNRWNVLFDSLFKYYKILDDDSLPLDLNTSRDIERNDTYMFYDRSETVNTCSYACLKNEACRYMEAEKRKLEEGNAADNEIDIQHLWKSRCPYYHVTDCNNKKNEYDKVRDQMITIPNKDVLLNEYRIIFGRHNISDRFFGNILGAINKPNIQYLLTNYSGEMSLRSYRKAKEVHREGQAYKEMIARMYYLDDDLKNDTVQFDLAIERLKINSGHIDENIESMLKFVTNSIYDIESFCTDNENCLPLTNRFQDVFINVWKGNEL